MFDVSDKYMHMKSVNDFCKEPNLCPLMLVASYQESPICAINHLLRIDLSWLNNCIVLGGSVLANKKRKHKSIM